MSAACTPGSFASDGRISRAALSWFAGAALIVLATACSSPDETVEPAVDAPLAHLIDLSAVERFWVIQDQLAVGERVDEQDWRALFDTAAYRWMASDTATQERIRERMELCFQPDRQPLEAELAAAEGSDAIRWRHYMRMRDERAELEAYARSLCASTVLENALAIAQGYLPPGVVDPQAVTTPVHLVLFWPDAFIDDGAIYLDLIDARDRGERLELFLAHEFHHDYYALARTLPALPDDDPAHWVLLALSKLHMEGLADRIDKGGFPLQDLPGGSPGYAADYNRYYRAAPQTLARFDAALAGLPAADDPLEAAREAWDLLHYRAHPEGLYMVDTVAAAQGADVLLEDLGDPFAFLRRFQAVQPTFSASTLEYLDALEADLRR